MNVIRIFLYFISCAIVPFANASTEANVSTYFKHIRHDPVQLYQFLYAMPKGGDLHNHFTGATYAENLISFGSKDQYCVTPNTFIVTPATECHTSLQIANVQHDSKLYNALVDSWSLRNFVTGKESAADHFFNSFGKFGLLVSQHAAEVLTEISNRAGQQHLNYLELMLTSYDLGMVNQDGEQMSALGRKIGWDNDLLRLRNKLLADGLKDIVNTIPGRIDAIEAGMRQQAHCTQSNAQPGCHVTIRYQYLALRGLPPAEFFAQLVGAFEAAKLDKRIIGINVVQAEHGPIAIRDYKLHMRMLDTLHSLYPKVAIALHAGEITATNVTADALRFHIHDAIVKGHAQRIGHGVDIAYEDNSQRLLKQMVKRQILVEINLTSNAFLLGVTGKKHPFPVYLQHQVPVTLATDDEGILRTNLTREYQRAVTDYQLNYPTLKMLARNSLSYSFLPGASLWQKANSQQLVKDCARDQLGATIPSYKCQVFLKANEKARVQWQLEQQFTAFEQQFKPALALRHD